MHRVKRGPGPCNDNDVFSPYGIYTCNKTKPHQLLCECIYTSVSGLQQKRGIKSKRSWHDHQDHDQVCSIYMKQPLALSRPLQENYVHSEKAAAAAG